MSRAVKVIISISIIMLNAVATSAGNGGLESVRRGEYANALSSMHDLDPATRTAYLMMAGDYEGAAGEVGDSGDPLLETFVRFKLEDWSGVLEVSGDRCLNRYLDIFRIYMRSVAFMKNGSPESVIMLTELLRPEERQSSLFIEDHQLYEELLDVRMEALALSESGRYDEETGPEILGKLGRETLLQLASRALKENDHPLAADIVSRIKPGGMDKDDRALYDELLNGLLSSNYRIDKGTLADYCSKAIHAGLEKTAGTMIERLEKDPSEKWETEFLKGLLLEKRDRLRQAKNKYRQIFRSGAPVRLKKESLLRIASIEYSIRHLEKSASSLRLFGVYYPHDRRAESVLDRAARIHVARKKWEKAIEVWDILGEMGPVTRQGRAGVLSQAVLCMILEDRSGARKILGRLLGDGQRLLRDGGLYWMYRACDDPDSASVYLQALREEYPVSIYTYAAGREKELLHAGPGHSDTDIVVMESSEKRSGTRPDGESPADEARRTSEIVDAFEYLVRSGLLTEAARCVPLLGEIIGSDADGLWYIYGVLRDRGMIRSSISLLDRLTRLEGKGKVPWKLLYPVPYAGIISASAERENVPAELVLSVIREESLFEVNAVSRAGALGLMQLMPSTGKWIGEKMRRGVLERDEIFAPQFNIDAGTWYLRFLLDRSSDSLVGALAAYNAGNAKMSDWRKYYRPQERPLIAMEMIGLQETREYVRRVLNTYAAYRTLYSAGEEGR